MSISLDDIKKLATHNEGIDIEFKKSTGQLNRGMETLYYSGLIEKWGRGLSLMVSECRRVGLPDPKIVERDDYVWLIFQRPEYGRDTVGTQSEYGRDTVGTRSGHSRDTVGVQ